MLKCLGSDPPKRPFVENYDTVIYYTVICVLSVQSHRHNLRRADTDALDFHTRSLCAMRHIPKTQRIHTFRHTRRAAAEKNPARPSFVLFNIFLRWRPRPSYA